MASKVWYTKNGYILEDSKSTLTLGPCRTGPCATLGVDVSNADVYYGDDLFYEMRNYWLETVGNVPNEDILDSMIDNLGQTVHSDNDLLDGLQEMNAQRYQPTLYIVDYDQDAMKNDGFTEEWIEKVLKDRIVFLYPDTAQISIENLSTIAGDI